MAVTPFAALDEAGLKTLVKTIFGITEENYIKKMDLSDEVLTQLVKYSFEIKDEDGCLYLIFPDDVNQDIVDAAIQAWNEAHPDLAPQE